MRGKQQAGKGYRREREPENTKPRILEHLRSQKATGNSPVYQLCPSEHQLTAEIPSFPGSICG
jgi:hypothetical protein